MRRKIERKSGGFTLVEILVAITVLGIVIVPFMHSFVTASRTNAKAKTLQNATALGTSLMEEIKANSIEELAFEFNYPNKTTDSGSESRFDIIDAGTFESVEEVRADGDSYQPVLKYKKDASGADNRKYVTASVLYEDYQSGSSDEYEYLGQESGKYYFVMKGVKSGTGTYDALITMDANAYKTVDDKGYNDQTTPIIDSVDVLQDAFYVQSAGFDEEYAKKIYEESGSPKDILAESLLDGDLSNGELKRTITIDIEKSGNLTNVYVTYDYQTYNYKPGLYSTSSKKNLIYSNVESPGYELRSIYLCYIPNYASAVINSAVKDEIIVNNPFNVEAELFLIKQKQSSYNTYLYQMKDSKYYCEVSVREDVGNFNASSHKAALSVRTNLNENIYDSSAGLINKYSLTYSNLEMTQTATLKNAKNILDEKSLDGAEVKDRIYDVCVEVYEEGQADSNFSGSPIAVITGSKDN